MAPTTASQVPDRAWRSERMLATRRPVPKPAPADIRAPTAIPMNPLSAERARDIPCKRPLAVSPGCSDRKTNWAQTPRVFHGRETREERRLCERDMVELNGIEPS